MGSKSNILSKKTLNWWSKKHDQAVIINNVCSLKYLNEPYLNIWKEIGKLSLPRILNGFFLICLMIDDVHFSCCWLSKTLHATIQTSVPIMNKDICKYNKHFSAQKTDIIKRLRKIYDGIVGDFFDARKDSLFVVISHFMKCESGNLNTNIFREKISTYKRFSRNSSWFIRRLVRETDPRLPESFVSIWHHAIYWLIYTDFSF